MIGFDRYGKLVAALVPIDAVRILAGRGADVDAAVRNKIERMSRVFLTAASQQASAAKEDRAKFEAAPKADRKRRKDKRDKKRKAKAAHGKRQRRISRKI